MYICVCIYIYIYIHTHTHTHLLFFRFFPHIGYHRVLDCSFYTVGPCYWLILCMLCMHANPNLPIHPSPSISPVVTISLVSKCPIPIPFSPSFALFFFFSFFFGPTQLCGDFLALLRVWDLLTAFSRCFVRIIPRIDIFLMYLKEEVCSIYVLLLCHFGTLFINLYSGPRLRGCGSLGMWLHVLIIGLQEFKKGE